MVNLSEHKDFIIQQFTSGTNANQIGKILGCSCHSILRKLEQWGLHTPKKKLNYGKMHLHDEEIIKLFHDGLTQREIAVIIGCNQQSIRNRAKILDLDFYGKSKFYSPPRGKDRLEQLIQLYKNGLTSIEIINLLTNFVPADNSLDDVGNKYKLDINFFKNIDNEYKAYYLGWMFSDGNVRPNHISLEITDRSVIEAFKYVINYSGKFYERTRVKKGKQQKTLYRLILTREELSRDLISKGCIEKKSLVLEFPRCVPTELMHHFIRGLWEGDGTITYGIANKQYQIGFIGTKNMCEGFLKTINANATWNRPNKNKNTYSIRIYLKQDIIKFINYIYQDATIFLPRKAIRANNYLNALCIKEENEY